MEEPVMKQLLNALPQRGSVVWLSIRPERKGPVQVVKEVKVIPGKGLEGDHYRGTETSKRQVTLIQHEHLLGVASMLGKENIDPAATRRNIVVKGINLLALKDKKFRIGEVLLETTGQCHPCSRMEENLGPGGYNAMRGHGGITTRVLEGGTIRLGDEVYVEA
jgi:MOSC domain-containing protein YiiM